MEREQGQDEAEGYAPEKTSHGSDDAAAAEEDLGDQDKADAVPPNMGSQEVTDQTKPTTGGSSSSSTDKVRVRFKAVGNAPRMKKNKFYVSPNETVAVLRSFLKRQLKLDSEGKLFLYCNSSFAPALDQEIGVLHTCFAEKTTNDLIIDYGTTGAYG